MGFLYEKFGIEKAAISESDRKLIHEQLRIVDENRLKFFANIVLVAITGFLILDFFYFNNSFRNLYLFTDSLLWIVTCSIVVTTIFFKNKSSKALRVVRKIQFNFFPLFLLLWATAVCAFDQSSILNLITFYFVLFLIAFAVTTPIKKLLLFYAIIIVEFIALSLLTNQPVTTENSAVMIMVSLLILPFYYSFRAARINSQAALVMLSDAKKNLQDEVDARVRELQLLNNHLKNEIGQRKIIESKLRETLKLAESNNKLKTEFLANISHEIRTPLNAIIGFTEMLFEDSVTLQRKKEFQELVEVNTSLLLSTIDDIFDVSLINTEQINPVFKPFSLTNFLDNIFYEVNGIGLKYQKQYLELVRHPLPAENLTIVSDEYFLKKAFLRLADNAYKFTDRGSIEIGVTIGKERIDFFVSDTGTGIPEKDSIKIFEPFVQGDGSFTRDYGGSGLGLTIAKGIVRSLNGTLTFTSKTGSGSKFTISFDTSIIQD
jgi:signal transduction histidine kinase